MPTLAPSHRSKPVRGSVLVAAELLTDEDEEVVATGVELAPEGTAGALEAWPAVDGAGVDDGVELDCDDVVVLEPDPLDPPSGSVYCWSPADGPDASAAAGATHANATSTNSDVTVRRRRRTARVLQAAKIVARAGMRRRRASAMPGLRPNCPLAAKMLVCRIYCTTRSATQERDGSC